MSVTNYYRFKPHSIFGLVGTGDSITFITRLSHIRRYVAVTACQLVVIWDTRRNVKVATLQCPEVRGTACIVSARPPTDNTPENSHLAVGYSTGDVVVFSIKENQSIDPTVFDGHRGTVTSLAWDHAGMRLASSGTDGEIVIWDVLSERGVVRLRGHRGPVTRVLFLRDREVLVSSGKDGFVKFWDLPTAHCFRTIAPLNSEVWDIALVKDDSRLVVGGGDAVLQVWALAFTEPADKAAAKNENTEAKESDGATDDPVSKFFCMDTEGQTASLEDIAPLPADAQGMKLPENDASILSLEKVGRLQRSKATRVLGLTCSGSILACYGKHNSLDLFKVHSEEEVKEKVRRRLKKTRKRLRESGAEQIETETAACDIPQLEDEIRAAASLPVHGRLAGVCVGLNNDLDVHLATLYSDNSLAVLRWRSTDPSPGSDGNPDDSTICHINHDGHRSEVRVAQFTSVGDTLVTLSNDSVKTWHRSQYECVVTHTAPLSTLVRTMVIAPGDRHVVLGTSSGHIMLLELATGVIIEDIEEAHGQATETAEVTALCLTADCKGLVSGGNDKNVRYWKFELVSDEAAGRRLSLEASGSAVAMQDAVTALDCSRDGRLLAVATMDNKETLYYADTMKLHQELYGKSLPTTSLCFSSDGDILVTGSKDTAIRIYGTDFGDMRKLIKNAHTGGVTSVQFQASTHLFFSTGHDGCLNYWDADNFQRILTLKGHTGIVRCLTLPPKGNWVATSGQDASLRLWEGTNELLSLEEEREEERRRLEEEEEGDDLMAGQKKHVEGETKDAEAVRANKPSYKTDLAVDMILTGLNMYQQYLNTPDAPPHYLMITYGITDPVECFCEILNRIKPSQLEEAIVQLELCQVLQLLVVLCRIGARGQLTEVTVRVALIAVRTNMPQLNASRNSLTILQTLNKYVTAFTNRLQDEIGFNRAGLKLCADRYEKRTEIQMFAEAMGRLSMQTKKKKRKENATKRAMLTL